MRKVLKSQFYIVSALKRYRTIVKQDMLKALYNKKQPKAFVVARQKSKIYETLISTVVHEGVEDTIQFSLQLYAKLPHTPTRTKDIVKACESALEAFFLLTDVNPNIQQLYNRQRPATEGVIEQVDSIQISPQVPSRLTKTFTESIPINHNKTFQS